jgi:hypothetical protein
MRLATFNGVAVISTNGLKIQTYTGVVKHLTPIFEGMVLKFLPQIFHMFQLVWAWETIATHTRTNAQHSQNTTLSARS